MYSSKHSVSEGRRKISKFNTVNENILNPSRLIVRPKTYEESDGAENLIVLNKRYPKYAYNPLSLKYKTNMVSDLLANLSVSIAEKEQLTQLNTNLKKAVLQLRKENSNLALLIKENKEMYEESIKNLQMEVASNERAIINRSKDVLIRQKRYVDNVIGKLNYENKILKNNINKMEQQFKHKLKEVEYKLKH